MILLSAWFFSDSYSKHMKKRLSECEGFLSFIAHIRLQMSCFLKPPKALSDGFYSKPLSESGFLEYIAECDSIYDAYKMAERKFSLSAEERGVLEKLFSSLGGGYLEDEIKLIDAYQGQLQSHFEVLKKEAPRNSKLLSTVSVTAAIGFLILLI